jgi:hypothetical protein
VDYRDWLKDYDAFLSYAGEDEKTASEIAGALRSHGFKIWYAEDSLKVGDSLLDAIEAGMSRSRAGVLLISKTYLSKRWPNAEMDVLIREYIEKKRVIFPVWLDVSKEDVERRHSILAGIVALRLSMDMPTLIAKLAEELSSLAPNRLFVPSYESPVHRFLSGLGEATVGRDGPATTLWELLVHNDPRHYPIWLEGQLYAKEDLLLRAAQILAADPNRARPWVNDEKFRKVWDMCKEAGFDPKKFE